MPSHCFQPCSRTTCVTALSLILKPRPLLYYHGDPASGGPSITTCTDLTVLVTPRCSTSALIPQGHYSGVCVLTCAHSTVDLFVWVAAAPRVWMHDYALLDGLLSGKSPSRSICYEQVDYQCVHMYHTSETPLQLLTSPPTHHAGQISPSEHKERAF